MCAQRGRGMFAVGSIEYKQAVFPERAERQQGQQQQHRQYPIAHRYGPSPSERGWTGLMGCDLPAGSAAQNLATSARVRVMAAPASAVHVAAFCVSSAACRLLLMRYLRSEDRSGGVAVAGVPGTARGWGDRREGRHRIGAGSRHHWLHCRLRRGILRYPALPCAAVGRGVMAHSQGDR